MSKIVPSVDVESSAAIAKGCERLRGKNWGPPASLLRSSESPSPLCPRLPFWEDVVKAEDPVPMRVRVHFMKLQHVDTVSQEFETQVWIQFKWREHVPVGLQSQGEKESLGHEVLMASGVGAWAPTLSFLGSIGNVDEERATRFVHCAGDGFVSVRRSR